MRAARWVALGILLLATGCRSGLSHSKLPGTTDEEIILRCRSEAVPVAEVDKELGSRPEWGGLKSKMAAGDEVWRFSTPPPSWENLMGWAGYAVFRNGRLVGSVTTERN